MNSSINLASAKKAHTRLNKKRIMQARLLAGICLSGVVLTSLILFLINAAAPLNNIKKEQNTIRQQLLILKSRSDKLAVVKNRIASIKDITARRRSYRNNIAIIRDNVPQGVAIDTLALDKSTMNLTLSTDKLLLMDNAINNFTNLIKERKLYKNLTLQNFGGGVASGNYSLILNANQ